jgi:nitrogenase molybdenum-iron protein alpha/beta subunit
MIATCVTDLIGEDFEGIISELQPRLNARLSFVTLGQFKNFGGPIGTWKTAEALGCLMTAKPKSRNTANALFIEPWRDKNAVVEFPLIVGALEERGVPIRRIAAGATLEDYMSAPDAAMNLVLSAYTQPLAAKMEEAFGTPYAPLHNAYRVTDIDRVYGDIAETLGISLEGAFDPWRKKAVELEKRAETELRGLRYAALTGVDMPVAMALYLAGFGMEPLLLHIQDFHNEDIGYAKKLKALGYDPPACRIMHRDRDIEIIRRLGPDISFGYLSEPIEGFRCAEEMEDFFGVTGYERTVGLLSRIFAVLETGKTEGRLNIYGPAPL